MHMKTQHAEFKAPRPSKKKLKTRKAQAEATSSSK
jgi:hypothetical protein